MVATAITKMSEKRKVTTKWMMIYDVVHVPSESVVLAIHVAEVNINAAENGNDIANLVAT
jgi:hypothetical protein